MRSKETSKGQKRPVRSKERSEVSRKQRGQRPERSKESNEVRREQRGQRRGKGQKILAGVTQMSQQYLSLEIIQ